MLILNTNTSFLSFFYLFYLRRDEFFFFKLKGTGIIPYQVGTVIRADYYRTYKIIRYGTVFCTSVGTKSFKSKLGDQA